VRGQKRVSAGFLFGLAVLLSGGVGRADDTVVKIIPLKHRLAEDLVAVLTPLAGPEGGLSALDNRLVVRATPRNLARIEEALLALDSPLRSLMITVGQRLGRSNAREAAGVGGAATSGGTTVVVPPPGPESAAAVETRTSRTRVQGAFSSEDATSADEVTQQVRTVEGFAALIHVGRSEPVAVAPVEPPPAGATESTGTVFAESGTGFHVLPRLGGNFVTLELWAENTRGAGPVVEGQRISTAVSGRLGEWIEVGGALREAETRVRGLFGSSSRALTEERSVRVRVDELR
jgi:Bacterial type II/III secretion system short domain